MTKPLQPKILKALKREALELKSMHTLIFGPFQFKLELDIQKPEIGFKFIVMYFFTIIDFVFNKDNLKCERGFKFLGFGCQCEFEADFDDCELLFDLEICVPILGCMKERFILLKW